MGGFDINKPYRTRDGREAWVVETPEAVSSTWGGESFSLIGYVKGKDSRNRCYGWSADGTCSIGVGDRNLDLVNIPEKRTVKVWISLIHEGPIGWGVHASKTRTDADRFNPPTKVACIEREITYEVGEGLS